LKIGITTFGCDLKSGMSRYVSNLITQFASFADHDCFEVLAHGSANTEYMENVDGGNVEPVRVAEWLSNPLLNVAWHQTILPIKCYQRNMDALFLPAASRRTPLWVPCPTIGTIHDLSPFHITGKYDRARNVYQTQVLPLLLKRLTHIIAISESTKRDIQKYVGVPDEHITVIHHAADTDVFYPRDKAASANAVRSYGVRGPYVIYTSRIESPGKNHLRLVRAFEKLKKEEAIPHQLVLAGADWHGAEEVHKAVVDSPYKRDILLTGYVHDKDLPNLYCGADMLAFPSLFEGFGLPILEAMACGVPVACSNLSSMPEIAGGAAALFDPHDVDSIASSMLSILSSEEEASNICRRGLDRAADFSWEKTARKTIDVIHNVVNG
jgi:glycosyltransferase involved in cell wall biosynthesis